MFAGDFCSILMQIRLGFFSYATLPCFPVPSTLSVSGRIKKRTDVRLHNLKKYLGNKNLDEIAFSNCHVCCFWRKQSWFRFTLLITINQPVSCLSPLYQAQTQSWNKMCFCSFLLLTGPVVLIRPEQKHQKKKKKGYRVLVRGLWKYRN